MGASSGSFRSRWSTGIIYVLVLLCFVTTLALATPAVAYAQEDAGQEEKKGGNLFVHIIESAGIFFGPLLAAVSICLVTLIVLLAMDLRLNVALPPTLVDEFTELVNKRQFKQAFELTRNDNSFLARVLSSGMGRLQYGIDDAREACFNMVDSVRAGKEQLINYLGTIGTLGPMLGLVGTVFGMILAFMELSHGGTPKPEKLAAGISHALVVTLIGIGIAVPAIFCHTFFKNRLTRISMDSSTLADDLLTQMYHNSRRAGAPAGASASADARGSTATQAGEPRG